MPEKEFNEVFSRRLRYYLEKNNMTQKDLATALGVGQTAVSDWINGRKSPRMSKVDAMCDLFGCTRSDLVEDHSADQDYYLDEESREAAEFLHKNPAYKILFDATRKVKPEDIDFIREMIERTTRDE
jgi:transcriptional regulator with XRE-family HTH domain